MYQTRVRGSGLGRPSLTQSGMGSSGIFSKAYCMHVDFAEVSSRNAEGFVETKADAKRYTKRVPHRNVRTAPKQRKIN